MSLQDDLDRLSNEHGPSALASAFASLQTAIRRRRAKLDAKLGPLARTIIAAMKIWDQQKAQGVPKAERVAGLEKTLRAAWPQTRVWEYACEDCDDTGLIRLDCTREHRCNGISTRVDYPGQKPGQYLRLCAQHPESDYTHDYCLPCHCVKGLRFKPAEKSPDDDLAAVGKVGKGFTRFGR